MSITKIDATFAKQAVSEIQKIVDCMNKRIKHSDEQGQIQVSPEMALFLTNFLNNSTNDCLEIIKQLD
jgi:hypothetical protein